MNMAFDKIGKGRSWGKAQSAWPACTILVVYVEPKRVFLISSGKFSSAGPTFGLQGGGMGGGEAWGGASPAAAVHSTMNGTTTKRMMMTIMRRIMEVMITMQFDWPRHTFSGPFRRQIQGGKGCNSGIGGACSTEREAKC
jgi:hypothetical protein